MESLDILILVLIVVLLLIAQTNKEQFATEDINTCLKNCPGYDPENELQYHDTEDGFDKDTWTNQCLTDFTNTPTEAEKGCAYTLECIQSCYPAQ